MRGGGRRRRRKGHLGWGQNAERWKWMNPGVEGFEGGRAVRDGDESSVLQQ